MSDQTKAPTPHLLPCPFCGNAAIFRQGRWGGPNFPDLFSVECSNYGDDRCQAQIGNFTTRELAVAAWNRRAPVALTAQGINLIVAALNSREKL